MCGSPVFAQQFRVTLAQQHQHFCNSVPASGCAFYTQQRVSVAICILYVLMTLQVRHFLAAGGYSQNPCLSCSDRNVNASFII